MLLAIAPLHSLLLKNPRLKRLGLGLLQAINLPVVRHWFAFRLRRLVAEKGAGKTWLHLACGTSPFPDWINVDPVPYSPGPDVLLDLRRPLPLPDGSIDLIYSEDFIEHISLADGRKFLGECYRVLRPGGTMRLLTPNLRVLAAKYLERDPGLQACYQSTCGITRFAEIFNHGMRA
jgi:predicted SAM-dependent methyltransferase